MEAKRHEVAVLIRAGHGTNDIVTLTNVCRRTVSNVRKRIKDGQTSRTSPDVAAQSNCPQKSSRRPSRPIRS
ncbi:Uncharacterized protein FKW44_004029 [Caligus rogercresseyi]|uniref:Uncharacterized protein n=1 Tax=Caligus rogercresseyi TaxID=217165 RepID=A0A7T8HLB2_CALRO|nr:Uncharacterized protein FKW44_004029 [Caligus rogercresseyi]